MPAVLSLSWPIPSQCLPLNAFAGQRVPEGRQTLQPTAQNGAEGTGRAAVSALLISWVQIPALGKGSKAGRQPCVDQTHPTIPGCFWAGLGSHCKCHTSVGSLKHEPGMLLGKARWQQPKDTRRAAFGHEAAGEARQLHSWACCGFSSCPEERAPLPPSKKGQPFLPLPLSLF